MQWFLKALKNYAGFSGRSQRAEFWYFMLFYMLIYIAVVFIETAVGLNASGVGILSLIFSLAMFLPSLAVSVRRLHDTDRTGWWVLIGLVPLLGLIVLIIFYVQDSTPGPNKYGPNPKAAAP